MAHASGNPTWQDYPSLATPVTAATLESIEGVLDRTDGRAFARYHCAVPGGQSITANGTPQNIPFDVDVSTHPDVSRGSPTVPTATYLFTLNRAGVWTISTGIRFQSTGGTLNQLMIWNGTSSAVRYAETQQATGLGSCITTSYRFPAGAVVAAGLAILSTATPSKVATDVPGSTFITFTWERT